MGTSIIITPASIYMHMCACPTHIPIGAYGTLAPKLPRAFSLPRVYSAAPLARLLATTSSYRNFFSATPAARFFIAGAL